MKLKILSLMFILGLFAFGTNVVAQEEKVEAPTAPTVPSMELKAPNAPTAPSAEMKAPAAPMKKEVNTSKTENLGGDMPALIPNYKENKRLEAPAKEGEDKKIGISWPSVCTPTDPSFNAATCARTLVHTFMTGQLCADTTIAALPACGNACKPPVNYTPTLNDLSCCIKAANISSFSTLGVKLISICEFGFSTQVCSNDTAKLYGGYLCCSFKPSLITNCISPNTCGNYQPQNCVASSKNK
ncbi:MAG: hypothetical protein K2P93_03320 [Alphaproteobacteria bacterium]|nr:hypothetical protein [Alphaproteobacteria bacterium]